jgi:hypothetical protein
LPSPTEEAGGGAMRLDRGGLVEWAMEDDSHAIGKGGSVDNDRDEGQR